MKKKLILIILTLFFLISCTNQVKCEYKQVSSFLDKINLMDYIRQTIPNFDLRTADDCNPALQFFLTENTMLRNYCVQNLQQLCTPNTFTPEKAYEICDNYINNYVDKITDDCSKKQLYCCNCYSAGFEQETIFSYKTALVSSSEKCDEVCGTTIEMFRIEPTKGACNAKCPEGMNPYKVKMPVNYGTGINEMEIITFCCPQGKFYDLNTQSCSADEMFSEPKNEVSELNGEEIKCNLPNMRSDENGNCVCEEGFYWDTTRKICVGSDEIRSVCCKCTNKENTAFSKEITPAYACASYCFSEGKKSGIDLIGLNYELSEDLSECADNCLFKVTQE